jgi:WD40 repeat protein
VDDEGKKFHYLASCGHNSLAIYEVEMGNPKGVFELRQSYKDEATSEQFYACAYAGRSKYWGWGRQDSPDDSSEDSDTSKDGSDKKDGSDNRSDDEDEKDDSNSSSKESSKSSDHKSKRSASSSDRTNNSGKKRPRDEDLETLLLDSEKLHNTNYLNKVGDSSTFDGPQLLCVAGAGGLVKVIDPVQQRQVALLKGHGSDIYDMKVSPTDENLLLTGSVDESIRLWNLQSFACVAMFGGQNGHREAVLSLSWHATGCRFASSGIDKSIRLWKIDTTRVTEAVQASQKLTPTGNRESFHPLCEQFPYFATLKAHLNFVDCVQFLGDMILSKSTYNSIVLWMPDIPEDSPTVANAKSAAYSPPSDVIVLRTFDLEHCNIWFVRFSIDDIGRLLAVGNIKGEVDIWDIDTCKKRSSQTLKPIVNSMVATVRMISFSPDGKTLVACHDTGTVCKWDEW